MARESLERITVFVQGEISGLSSGYSYYVYFSLRDSESTLPALLTKRQFKSLDFKMEDGAMVLARGTLSLYEKGGKYQLRVADLSPFGEGDLLRRIEALKRKLQAEGLFKDSAKKPLPRFPLRIGVVTSTRGAAIRDVTVTAGRRFPPAAIYVRGVTVQGNGAIQQICAALDFFDREFPVDLVILARGGGSIEDLEPFSTEEVARAIVRLRVPLISGIGHEPDVSVSDLVADWRAGTPTGAAEAAVPDRSEVAALLGKTAGSFHRHVARDIQAAHRQLVGMRRGPLWGAPEFLLGKFMQRWERAAGALSASPGRGISRNRGRLALVTGHPVFRRPGELLAGRRAGLEVLRARLARGIVHEVERNAGSLAEVKARVEAMSPLAVLSRGYSITFHGDKGGVVRSSDEVERGTPLKIRLGRGTVEADVTGKE
jgi:exodeoxyribonuclease VII large subunit